MKDKCSYKDRKRIIGIPLKTHLMFNLYALAKDFNIISLLRIARGPFI